MKSLATAATELAVRLSADRALTPGASSDRLTAVPARDHCLVPERVEAPAREGGRYGRMFDLPALEVDEALLHQIGAVGGFSDGGYSHGDARAEAGWPFFGQYVAHDLTADRSPLRAHADVFALRNMRSPRANLESLYGGGPVGSPYLYRRDDPAQLLEDNGDVPRNHEGIAVLGDPRNDTQVFMSQMQVAFIRAHNRLVDALRAHGVAEGELFAEGRRALSWHYQWLIVNDFLPGAVGRELVDELLDDGPRYYQPRPEPFIPVEFADAAYRYGHSQIRQLYQLQPGRPARPLFPDLIGFGPVEERRVDWSLLFDVPGHPPAQRAKPIDGRLPHTLIELPTVITGEVEDQAHHSLAARDLQRGEGTGLPSGESVARAIGVQPLSRGQVGLQRYGWVGETPLWLYVLRESAVQHGGEQLGTVGGRIVGEVLVGIISNDPESYLAVDPNWTPTLPQHQGTFRVRDLLVPA
jgi:Animal haem peroxidase